VPSCWGQEPSWRQDQGAELRTDSDHPLVAVVHTWAVAAVQEEDQRAGAPRRLAEAAVHRIRLHILALEAAASEAGIHKGSWSLLDQMEQTQIDQKGSTWSQRTLCFVRNPQWMG
jgi:hypothetical protein